MQNLVNVEAKLHYISFHHAAIYHQHRSGPPNRQQSRFKLQWTIEENGLNYRLHYPKEQLYMK